MIVTRAVAGVALFVIALSTAFAPRAAAQPAFEAASVKALEPNRNEGMDFLVLPGGSLRVTSLTLKTIVQEAYGFSAYQISGGPAWFDAERFDIDAKAAGSPSRDQTMAMLQTLLEDRFKLKIHRGARADTVYTLSIGKNGPKLKGGSTEDRPVIHNGRNGNMQRPALAYWMQGQNASMAALAHELAVILRHPVMDDTGLTGGYDFRLDYDTGANDATGDASPSIMPSIFTAVQQDLGLKLTAQRGSVQILVIDSAERPTSN